MSGSSDRPGAQGWVPDQPSLPKLQSDVQACRGCELYADASSFRVGEARGRMQGRPDCIGDVATGDLGPRWAVATTHPSAILRSRNRDEAYELFVRDLKVAAEGLL